MNGQWYGYNPPFLGGAQNVLSKQMDERLIKNDLRQLLLTAPGQRVHREGFGTQIRNFPFENLDDPAALDLLRDNIIEQINKYEERVRVVTVNLTGDDATQTLSVSVKVALVNEPLVSFLVEVKLNKS